MLIIYDPFYPNFLQSVETRHGAMLTVGHMAGLLLRKRRERSGSGSSQMQNLDKKIETAVTFIGKTLNSI